MRRSVFIQTVEVIQMEKYKEFVLDKNADTSVDGLMNTADAVLQFVETNDLEDFDFTGFQANHVNTEHLATLLRMTFRWSMKIKGWDEALIVARDAAVINGYDPDDILYGMI